MSVWLFPLPASSITVAHPVESNLQWHYHHPKSMFYTGVHMCGFWQMCKDMCPQLLYHIQWPDCPQSPLHFTVHPYPQSLTSAHLTGHISSPHFWNFPWPAFQMASLLATHTRVLHVLLSAWWPLLFCTSLSLSGCTMGYVPSHWLENAVVTLVAFQCNYEYCPYKLPCEPLHLKKWNMSL